METKDVIAFGELLWDCLPSGTVLGGAPANFALRLHNLGVSVALVSRIGKDELGGQARDRLLGLGLDDTYVQTDDTVPTGTVDVKISPEGNASYTILEGVAYDYITLTPELTELASKAKLICYGSLVQREPVSRATLVSLLEVSPHAVKLVDINLRKNCYSPETIDTSLRFADILKLNESEVAEVSSLLRGLELGVEEFCEYLFMYYGLKHILVTRAEKGVFACSKSGEKVDLNGFVVDVKDTIGSGDAFTAGFVSQFLLKKSLAECCECGNKLGALVATKVGGMATLSATEIEACCVNQQNAA